MLFELHAAQLPTAPTFGSAGEPPPPATPWIPVYWGLFDAELMESDDVDAVWRAFARTEAVSILSRDTDVSLTEGVDDSFLSDRLDASKFSAQLPAPRTGPIEDEPRYKEGLANALFSVVVQPPTDPIGSYRSGYEEAKRDPSWGSNPDIDHSIKMSQLVFDSSGVVYNSTSTFSPKAHYLGELQAKLQITDDSEARLRRALRTRSVAGLSSGGNRQSLAAASRRA
jgi:hypothetical protein